METSFESLFGEATAKEDKREEQLLLTEPHGCHDGTG
jgi:hypothetical protein